MAHFVQLEHVVFGTYEKRKKRASSYCSCVVCNTPSECDIYEWKKRSYIMLIPIKVVDRGYIFFWKECEHAQGIFERADVQRYKEEQETTGLFQVPLDYHYKVYSNITLRKLRKAEKIILINMAALFVCLIAFAFVIFPLIVGYLQ
jgi:hypothetical protein